MACVPDPSQQSSLWYLLRLFGFAEGQRQSLGQPCPEPCLGLIAGVVHRVAVPPGDGAAGPRGRPGRPDELAAESGNGLPYLALPRRSLGDRVAVRTESGEPGPKALV